MNKIAFGLLLLCFISCHKTLPLDGDFYDLKSKYDVIGFDGDTLIIYLMFKPFVLKQKFLYEKEDSIIIRKEIINASKLDSMTLPILPDTFFISSPNQIVPQYLLANKIDTLKNLQPRNIEIHKIQFSACYHGPGCIDIEINRNGDTYIHWNHQKHNDSTFYSKLNDNVVNSIFIDLKKIIPNDSMLIIGDKYNNMGNYRLYVQYDNKELNALFHNFEIPTYYTKFIYEILTIPEIYSIKENYYSSKIVFKYH